MTLPDLLAGDLLRWMDSAADGIPRRVLLWLDPQSEFEHLVPLLDQALNDQGVRLVRLLDRKQQLSLKLELLRLDAGSLGPLAPPSLAGKEAGRIGPHRAILYLPGFGPPDLEPPSGAAPVLWSVVEYRYKGAIWGLGGPWQPGAVPEPPTLLGWLRSRGLRVDSGGVRALTAGGSESLLARYVLKYPERVLDDQQGRLRISDVRAALGGDPRDELRRLIRDPEATVAAWGSDASVVLDRLHEALGLASELDGSPSDYADEAAVLLALADAWEAYGQPDDFPFLARLPESTKQRQALATALQDDILPNSALRSAYRDRIGRLEGQYDLSGWALDREGWPSGLPGLAGRQWRLLLADLDREIEVGWKQGREFLLAHARRVAAGQKSPWNSEGDGRPWTALGDLISMCREATAAIDASVVLSSAAEMVRAYSETWFRIDGLHLRVRDICSREPDLEHVREIADGAYAEYVVAVNDRFTALVEAEGVWPPAGTTSVEAGRDEVWNSDSGRSEGIIISDALRWDLGQQVVDQIGDGATISPVLSTLPSITPYGMTVMLPLREGEPIIKWAGGPTIKDATGRSLAERSGRKALIEEVLKAGGRSVAFMEMNALLRSRKAPAGDVIVVFDNNIDAQGHKAVENFPALARKLVTDIRRSIEKLHGFGIPRVHVVTDHGFLLLAPEHVSALGQPEAPIALCVKRESRWAALKPDAAIQDVIRLPMPMSPNAGMLGFPRGIRTLVAPEPYMHGGISLQECVIPHIVAIAALPVARVMPDLNVAQRTLTTGTVVFTLRPAPLEQVPLGGVQPRRVRVLLQTAAAPKVRLAQREEELRQEGPELRAPLYLEEGHHLPAGSKLELKCLDLATGEELAAVPLTLAVAWE